MPCVLFAYGARHRRIGVIRVASVLALAGILLNRLNISVIAFNWDASVRYLPTWLEIVVTAAVIFGEIWVFRWVVNRMPVLREPHELPRRPALEPTSWRQRAPDGGSAMETYTFVNIFETKGLEYLLLICFLVLFVFLVGYLRGAGGRE